MRDLIPGGGYSADTINVMIPGFDFPNHRHPTKPDRSDFWGFNFHVASGALSLTLQQPVIEAGAEVEFAYNHDLEGFQLLVHYGFAIDNNLYAQTVLRAFNYVKQMTPEQLEMCESLGGCVDP